jgi:hypothetical protein
MRGILDRNYRAQIHFNYKSFFTFQKNNSSLTFARLAVEILQSYG